MYYLIKTDTISIRRLENNDTELQMLADWRKDERVSTYYGGRDKKNTLEKIKEKYVERIEGNTRITPCIFEREGHPAGYIQFYTFTEEMYKTHSLSSFGNAYGIDIFVSPFEEMSRGLGSSALKVMCTYLFSALNADVVEICPRKVNKRAVNAYKKAGFRYNSDLEKGEFFEGKWYEEYVMIMTEPPKL